jgi:hypothetical protein
MRDVRGSRRWRRLAAGALTGALIVLIAVAEPARAGWSVTYNLSASNWMAMDWPAVAVDRQGDAIMAWAACDAAESGCYHQVQVRQKTPTGALGPIKTLSPKGASTAWPEVATDDDGDSVVVWQQDGRVYGRRVSRTGAVGSLLPLSTTAAINPTVVVDPIGTGLAVWSEIRSGSFYTVARFIYPSGAIGSPITLGNGEGDQPAAVVDRSGKAVVAWTESNARVVARRMKPGYLGPRTVFTSTISGIGYGRVSAGVDRDGDAVIAFRRADNNTGRSYLWARQWSRTGTIGKVLGIAPSTDNLTFYSELAMDLEGDYVVVWSRRTSQTQTDVYARRVYRTGTLGTVTRLGVGDRPAIAVDDDGDGNAVWQSPGPPYESTKVYARRIAKTGAYGTTALLTTNGSVVRADSSPGGRVAVVWQQKSYPYTIHARFGS